MGRLEKGSISPSSHVRMLLDGERHADAACCSLVAVFCFAGLVGLNAAERSDDQVIPVEEAPMQGKIVKDAKSSEDHGSGIDSPSALCGESSSFGFVAFCWRLYLRITWDLTSLFVARISKSAWPLRPTNVKLSPGIDAGRFGLGTFQSGVRRDAYTHFAQH